MRSNTALVIAVVSLVALAAPGCKSRSKGVGVADASSTAAVELPMKSALNDSLAREVRELRTSSSDRQGWYVDQQSRRLRWDELYCHLGYRLVGRSHELSVLVDDRLDGRHIVRVQR